MMEDIFKKFNTAVPRYTSYPTVPHWQAVAPTRKDWISSINKSLDSSRQLSLYIHLPYCEKLCTYCGCNKRITTNHSVENAYIDALLTEWQTYLSEIKTRPILSELHLGGGTPTFFSPDNLHRLIENILRGIDVEEHPAMSLEIHPTATTTEHLQILWDLGFRRLSMGVQDISPVVLKAINREQSVDQIEALTQAARAIGYESINYDLIYGLPFQTTDDVENTIEFVSKQRPDRIALYSYAHVPWKSKGQRAFSIDDIPFGKYKKNLKKIGQERLIDLGYQAIGMDHYALASDSLYKALHDKTLHRNFMGYTDKSSNLLVGLGCSAISESSDMYIQNEKSVERYAQDIQTQGSSIFRGHHLSIIEHVLRMHIRNLFCYKETSWTYGLADAKIAELIPDQWFEMEDMGWLVISNDGVKINPAGEPYLRIICSAIDPKFIGSQAQTFSSNN